MSLPYEFTAEGIISQGRTTKENIEAIKTWLPESGSEFVPKFLCDEMIVLFLLSFENNLETVKTTITTHYKLKTESPDVFDNRNVDDDDMKLFFEIWISSAFPYRTANNAAIHYFELVDNDYSMMDNITLLKAMLMLMDVTQGKNPPDGLITVLDVHMSGLKHFAKFKLNATKKFFTYLQEGLPMKLEALHIINSNYVITKLYTILKTCIKNQLFEKIHLHPQSVSLEKLYSISPKVLPSDFGGDLPSLKELNQRTIKQFQQKQEYWNVEERIRKECPYYQMNKS